MFHELFPILPTPNLEAFNYFLLPFSPDFELWVFALLFATCLRLVEFGMYYSLASSTLYLIIFSSSSSTIVG